MRLPTVLVIITTAEFKVECKHLFGGEQPALIKSDQDNHYLYLPNNKVSKLQVWCLYCGQHCINIGSGLLSTSSSPGRQDRRGWLRVGGVATAGGLQRHCSRFDHGCRQRYISKNIFSKNHSLGGLAFFIWL